VTQSVGILLLARFGSTRLPGKVLREICGKTVVEHVIDRLQKVRGINHLILATTTNPADDRVADLGEKLGVNVFRGDEENVLARCVGACEAYNLNTTIRLGADCPFADWELLSDMLELWNENQAAGAPLDYLSNTIERTFPIGLDADILSYDTYLRIDKETRVLSSEQRILNEINVIPWVQQNPDRFNIRSVTGDHDLGDLRWTLDTPEDFELIEKIYSALYPGNPGFLMTDILELLESHPEWSSINAQVVPRSGHWTKKNQARLSRRYGISGSMD